MEASGNHRFALGAGEAMLCVADVRAETPGLAGALRRVRVTDRRVALCRVPGPLMRWVALVLLALPVAGLTAVALEWCVAALVALVALRQALPFSAMEREAPAAALRDVTQAGRALLLWFEDGSMWRLAPSRMAVDLGWGTSRAKRVALEQALGRLIGRGCDRPEVAK